MTDHEPISHNDYQALVEERLTGRAQPRFITDEMRETLKQHMLRDLGHYAVMAANPHGRFDNEPIAALRRAHYAAILRGKLDPRDLL